MLDDHIIVTPREYVNEDFIKKNTILMYNLGEPYEVEIYPHVFITKQKTLKSKITSFKKDKCGVIRVKAKELKH